MGQKLTNMYMLAFTAYFCITNLVSMDISKEPNIKRAEVSVIKNNDNIRKEKNNDSIPLAQQIPASFLLSEIKNRSVKMNKHINYFIKGKEYKIKEAFYYVCQYGHILNNKEYYISSVEVYLKHPIYKHYILLIKNTTSHYNVNVQFSTKNDVVKLIISHQDKLKKQKETYFEIYSLNKNGFFSSPWRIGIPKK
jgi:hypothetical protein